MTGAPRGLNQDLVDLGPRSITNPDIEMHRSFNSHSRLGETFAVVPRLLNHGCEEIAGEAWAEH